MNARKPCEYCGADLPVGVNRDTRRARSYHFDTCAKRPRIEAAPLPLDLDTVLSKMSEEEQQSFLDQCRARLFDYAPTPITWMRTEWKP